MRKINSGFALTCVSILFYFHSVSQTAGNDCKMSNAFIPSIDSVTYDLSECIPFKDANSKKVTLIFEEGFDGKAKFFYAIDQVRILNLKTIKNLGVCLEELELDIGTLAENRIIKIEYLDKTSCIRIIPNKRYLYANFSNGNWYFEASNCLRQYR